MIVFYIISILARFSRVRMHTKSRKVHLGSTHDSTHLWRGTTSYERPILVGFGSGPSKGELLYTWPRHFKNGVVAMFTYSLSIYVTIFPQEIAYIMYVEVKMHTIIARLLSYSTHTST